MRQTVVDPEFFKTGVVECAKQKIGMARCGNHAGGVLACPVGGVWPHKISCNLQDIFTLKKDMSVLLYVFKEKVGGGVAPTPPLDPPLTEI